MTNEGLTEACYPGDATAFEELWERYSGRLYSFALIWMGSADEAEEVLLGTFTKAVETGQEPRDPARFSAWVFSIARNVIRDRMARALREVSLDDVAHAEGDEVGEREAMAYEKRLSDERPSPDEEAIAKAHHGRILACLADLPDRERLVVKLWLSDETLRGIARHLGCPIATAHRVLQRAFKLLGERLTVRVSPG